MNKHESLETCRKCTNALINAHADIGLSSEARASNFWSDLSSTFRGVPKDKFIVRRGWAWGGGGYPPPIR